MTRDLIRVYLFMIKPRYAAFIIGENLYTVSKMERFLKDDNLRRISG